MHLIFLGDISVEHGVNDYGDFTDVIGKSDYALANLEGSIVSESDLGVLRYKHGPGLHNSPDVLDALKHFHVKAVWLANNHIYDFRRPARYTIDVLESNHIAAFGVGDNLVEAARPLVLQKANTTAKFFALGWDVIGCRPVAGERSEGVNPMTPRHAFDTLRQLRTVDQTSFVEFIMHWNYGLELYPQPAQRQLARDLIAAGADAVIGLHGHVAQGAELYQGKPIIYGLGNWFFPARQLGNLYLKYPPLATRQLALELVIEGRDVCQTRFHWHRFDVEQARLEYDHSEEWTGETVRQLTPFAGMSHSEYMKWFKDHRTRRRALPIYVDYHQTRANKLKDVYVELRQVMIRALVRWNLKGGPRV